MNKLTIAIFFWAACAAMAARAGEQPSETTPAVAKPWPSVGVGSSPAAERIRAALDEPTRTEFIETPLEQVVHFLGDMHQIPIQLDQRALDRISMPLNAPITTALKKISLRSALRLILRDLDLDFVIADEVLLITTPEVAAARAEIRVYNVTPLIGDDPDASGLAKIVTRVLDPAAAPPAYDSPAMSPGGMGGGGFFSVPEFQHGSGRGHEYGMEGYGGGHGTGHGGGSPCPAGGLGAEAGSAPPRVQITPMKGLLIVRGTDQTHRELSGLLAALETALESNPGQPPQAPAAVDPFAP